MEHEVLSFIENFKKFGKQQLEDTFGCGYCYYFAIILQARFDAKIMYIPVYNHFCGKIEDKLYDIYGLITDEDKISLAISWEIYKHLDKLETEILYRDCIYKLSE